jgi:3-hydroxyisobutyrate dehydrogenase
VWNRTRPKASDLATELGCAAPATPAELARDTDVIVLCVSADADLLAVIDALKPGLRTGQLVIDCSTVGADTARTVAKHLAGAGVEFLDCPVSGGVEGAREATLAIMCGGSAASFTRAQPVLAAMGRTVSHFGPVGAGQAAKATNQIMCAGIIEAVS